MKNLIPIGCLAVIIAGCAQSVDLSKLMPGTYSLTEMNVEQDGKSNAYNDSRMMKIYTDDHFMFTMFNPKDSTVSFGVGTYSANAGGDSIIEHNIYRSAFSSILDGPKDYHLNVMTTPQGYKQIVGGINIGDVPSVLTEFYSRVKDTTSHPLDGVWKETRSYMVVDGDTLPNDRVQYKAFYKGYFMFGNTFQSGPDETNSGMGYGTFKKVGDNEIEEMDLVSSYPVIMGNTFRVKYEMPDNDHFVQTITNADGSIGVEYYERLK